MKRTWKSPARRGRPGLTLVELLVAIAVLGVMGALLLPHVAPVDREPGHPISWSPTDLSDDGRIGALVDLDRTEDGFVRVHRPLPGTPAENAGLMPNDVVLEVDGTSTQYEDVYRVVQMIRGRAGTPVRLRVRHAGESEPFEVTIIRRTALLIWPRDGADW